MARQGATNVAIQLATLLSKSLLLFLLARYLSVADVGVFSLLAVTLSLGIHLLGLDFYAFATRELLAVEPRRLPLLLRDQLVLHLLTYPLALLLAVLPFVSRALPWRLLGLFLALLLAEHLGQEMQRALVTLGRPVQGALVLFLRAGVWVWVAAAVLISDRAGDGLVAVLVTWLTGSLAGILLGLLCLRDLPWSEARRQPVDWEWIRRGLRIAMPFMLASFAYRSLLTIDRYTLQYFAGSEAVGIYSFYANFRNAILSFIEMGILFVYRPRIVAEYQAGHEDGYQALLRQMGKLLVGVPIALALAAAMVVLPILDFVGKQAYRDHLSIFWLILLSAVMASCAEIPHTALYAGRRDRALISSTLLTLAIAIPLHITLVRAWGLGGAAAASLASFALLALSKFWLARRHS